MLGKKKSSAENPAENDEQQTFQKNIKLLWIYTSLFCLFAILLIAISSIIQGQINSEADYYQDKYHEAQTSSQSALKNIQDENAALKADLQTATERIDVLENKSASDDELITKSADIIENAEYLINAVAFLEDNKRQLAKDEFAKVDRAALTESMQAVYDSVSGQLK